ncbi:YraN family protein [Candidatus Aminicenantes bacterium AC-335-B20]|jgi:putative endonuclease|nr:YraN family protein [SCandidatus Aminicenantes bacterium Aminicenantia_JdfR_composite]MCP2597030.1 YraN family protein [Candidatus Aminicenantes bacterium AC-335-G13]MCP2599205.1 YraN family protein [Candidatus Aminicenantes bacterium AC-335-B20]MCP2618957.1 YraN family protein [Candidatus Aminicenantes bacterium AC-335-A11]MCP2619357.1 YraN family protein [Candidatus Aminicenantes bacterium AC-335-K20]MCP2621174.1 YraN family protein [Candidatus Aminicenantes bacterium AC-334-E05]
MWKKKKDINNITPHELGKMGEKVAEKYLKNKKIRIVERSFRAFGGEIDLIGYDGETLVFIEVKTRKGLDFGYPQEAVSIQKQKQLKKIAQGYIIKRKLENINCRFDVIGILFSSSGKPSIFHIKNAF